MQRTANQRESDNTEREKLTMLRRVDYLLLFEDGTYLMCSVAYSSVAKIVMVSAAKRVPREGRPSQYCTSFQALPVMLLT